ncbi:MAG: long-chain fatty acid--CoA ligase [Candidatus Hydrogenedentes bacterium]|nr:long-chain fatty acid--CoA ligase [Candidatus Hydrogenedentota bacterium]
MLNLAHFLDVTAESYPETTCVILDNLRMSYAEVASAARRVANALRSKGIGPGDKVAMMIPNTPHFPIIYYGILQTGATVVPVNVLYRHQEIEHYLADSEAVALFAFKLFEPEAVKAFHHVETCHHLIIVSTPVDLETPAVGENFMHLLAAVDDQFDTYQTMPDDTAVILYTSGTTGAPKGAELTHFNLFFNAYYACREINDVQPGDVCLVVLPLFHSFGQTCLMNASILGGATMSLLPRFETEKAMEVVARDKVNLIAMVPTMYFFMLNQPNWQEFDFSSVKIAVSGGAALPGDVHRRFKERYGINILEGYGLSETSPVATFTKDGDAVSVGSIGRPIWGVDVRVMREDGSFAQVDEVGEIIIRGHNIMKGYYRRPEATQEAIVNGWFHSGDLGKRDKDGFFYVVDRKKDLIIRGGMNIYPREIEEILYRHPKVLEAAVVGIPDESRGEEVKVYVSPKEGQALSALEIEQYCQEQMAKFKWPKEVEVLQNLPIGPTGKILKRELRQHALAGVREKAATV